MFRTISILIILTIFSTPLQAFDISKYLIPLDKKHKAIAERVYFVINTPNKKWKIDGTYPIDTGNESENELIFFLIPKYEDTNNWTERYIVHKIKFKKPSTLEIRWQHLKRVTDLPNNSEKEIVSQTDNEFVYQMHYTDPKKSLQHGHEFGLVVKHNECCYWMYEYYQKTNAIDKQKKEQLLEQFRKINKLLMNF